MNFSRAFSYIFDDRDWLSKLALTLVITVASALLTPFLIGLAGWALLLGYQSQLVRNWRAGVAHPLPRWTDYGGYLNTGGQILAALFVYNLPNLLIGACTWTLTAFSSGAEITSAGITLGISCCLFPILLAYNLLIWPMLALGIARFQDSGRINSFFQFADLFRAIRAQSDLTMQYLLMLLLTNLVLVLLAIIPCAGWVATPALLIPVQGGLIGQYVVRLAGRANAAPVPAAAAPRRR